MTKSLPDDKSNGYEQIAEIFIDVRSPGIGAGTVRDWSKNCKRGCSILDLGCGHGVPISQVLLSEGFAVYGIDASWRMIEAFRKSLPDAQAECSAVEDSEFFERTFDGAVAWGLIFLLPPDVQTSVIRKVARALNPGGKFLFTSPREACTWPDALTGRESVSLGFDQYQGILQAQGLTFVGEAFDEGDNHYYFAEKAQPLNFGG